MGIVPETGMDQDYLNDFLCLFPFAKDDQILIKKIKEFDWLPKKYEEHFPPDEYKNTITEANRENIKKLNAEVEKFKQRIIHDIDTLTVKEYKAYCQTLTDIIDPHRETR